MNKPYCYIDMDLTMVDVDLQPYEGLRDRLCELIKKYELVCWSAGGHEYAETILQKIGMRMFFTLVVDKPFVIIDDEPNSIANRARVVKVVDSKFWSDRESFWGNIFNKSTSLMKDLCCQKSKK